MSMTSIARRMLSDLYVVLSGTFSADADRRDCTIYFISSDTNDTKIIFTALSMRKLLMRSVLFMRSVRPTQREQTIVLHMHIFKKSNSPKKWAGRDGK